MSLSIVVPAYKSGDCLSELARRVQAALEGRVDSYELIVVNDDSPDSTWTVIESLTRLYPFVVGVNLRKNVGQDNAIMAGLHCATGSAVVIMDDDLQHAPEDIPALLEALRRGVDVVYARFNRKRQALWKNLGSWLSDRVGVVVLGKPPHVYMSPYKVIRREVVDELVKYEGPFTYIDGLIFGITSRVAQIDVAHHPRFAGRSNYNLVRSVKVWLKLVTGFSVIPLRLATIVGFAISVLSFAMALFFVVQAFVNNTVPEGYPSLIVTVFFLGGIQLMGIGAVGEYIGRVFITQNRPPQFTVASVVRGGLTAAQVPPERRVGERR